MCHTLKDENVQQFIDFVKAHTKEHGIKFVITKSKQLNIGCGVGRASGLFNQNAIRVAGLNRPFIRILGDIIHEYSHFIQFINNEEVWTKASRHNLDAALNNITMSDNEVAKMIELDKNLEIDAEKKAVAIIKKWNLPIDIDDYIKKANAYIYFYVYMTKYRKWCKKAPSSMPSILDMMPSKFCKKYDLLPIEYEKLINRYCVKS